MAFALKLFANCFGTRAPCEIDLFLLGCRFIYTGLCNWSRRQAERESKEEKKRAEAVDDDMTVELMAAAHRSRFLVDTV